MLYANVPPMYHQTPMTCTYGYSHFRHFQNCCNRDGNTIFKYMNYVPIVVATDLEVHFSVLKKGVSQYFCLYNVCTSHWCLVMSFWLKVCIYSHTRGVKLGFSFAEEKLSRRRERERCVRALGEQDLVRQYRWWLGLGAFLKGKSR